MFTKREIIHLIISVVVLGFVFGFDDGSSTFIFSNWFRNLLLIILIVAIAVLFRELVIKLMARRHEAISEYEIWNIKRVWFDKELPFGFPLGIILTLFLSVGSLGKAFFTAIGVHKISEYKSARTGRKHSSLDYFEEAQICSVGILSSLFLAVIGILVGRIFGINMSLFVSTNFFIALFNMIPLSSLDGAKIFFGSLLMYIFILVFVVVAFLLIKYSVILGLLVAFIIATIAVGVYFFYLGR